MKTAKREKGKVGRPRKNIGIEISPKLGIIDKPKVNDNLVEFLYDNTTLFKKLFNLLKLMNINEVNINFNTNFIRIYGVESDSTENIIDIKINANRMNHYYCKYPINVTVDPLNLVKVTQKIDKNYNLLCIVLKESTWQQEMYMTLSIKTLDIDENHIINLNHCTEIPDIDNLPDYTDYPLNFKLPSKYFKKMINDIGTFGEYFTIEKTKESLKFRYKGMNYTVKGITECKNDNKIELESSLDDKEIFSIPVAVNHIKALSNSLFSDYITIYADKVKDLVFNMSVDNDAINVIIYVTINNNYN